MFGLQPEPVVVPDPPVPEAPVPFEPDPAVPGLPEDPPEGPPVPAEADPAEVPDGRWPLLVEPPISLVDPPDWPALPCPALVAPVPAAPFDSVPTEAAPRPVPFPALRPPERDDKLPAGPPKLSDRPQAATIRETPATAIPAAKARRLTG
jgi:hypothetical protein